jgi:hypothetical protein
MLADGMNRTGGLRNSRKVQKLDLLEFNEDAGLISCSKKGA